MTPLTQKQLRLLKYAINDASAWRGQLIGCPDPEPLRQFDARIADMRAAWQAVVVLNTEAKALYAVDYEASQTEARNIPGIPVSTRRRDSEANE